jgi:hypothetical protein
MWYPRLRRVGPHSSITITSRNRIYRSCIEQPLHKYVDALEFCAIKLVKIKNQKRRKEKKTRVGTRKKLTYKQRIN